MWIFTREGFFSVVQDNYCDVSKGELMVRGRLEKDLERLREKIGSSVKIIELDHADYRYRMKVIKSEWATYLTDTVASLDYSNVKGTICSDSVDRENAYYDVWRALYNLQNKGDQFSIQL